MSSRSRRLPAFVLAAALAAACQSSGHHGSFLIFGGAHAPQEDLVERVHGAKAETASAREDYGTAFRLYQRLTAPQAVELEDLSDDFSDSIDDCQERADDLAERIESVRAASEELFKGWNEELTHFSGDVLRKKSEAMLQDTQARTQRVLDALERVRTRTDPVLKKLKDYALFFNHNLNARAIATLQDTYKDFDAEFKALDAELVKAQSEIAAFLANFEKPAKDAATAPAAK